MACLFSIAAQPAQAQSEQPAQSELAIADVTTPAALPSAPDPSVPAPQQAPASASQQPQQTQRILGIVPNFRSVSTTDKLPPQTIREKFMDATRDSFDYSSVVLPAVISIYDYSTTQTPEFHHGGIGYGRYLWHSALDQTSENYFVEFFVPVATHEDTRFYTLRDGSNWHKAEYALSRAVITRTDSGHETFNISEVLGAGMASALSNAYYPGPERTFANTGRQWGLDVGIDAAAYLVREFWPEINHAIFHN